MPPLTPRPLNAEAGSFMYVASGKTAPAGSVHQALNMLPDQPERDDGTWLQRDAFLNLGTGTAAGSAVVAAGSFYTASGTLTNWLLSSSRGLWTYDNNGFVGTYSNVVTAANFATASITLAAATHYWCLLGGTVIFTDGTNTPWMWDGGSGAAAVTELTAAPVAYGAPVVYYSRVFFIKDTERNTIVWSEADDPTTGYESGFSNAWTLTQTASGPLVTLAATNAGLYYFRADSIGVIRGAVTSDFTTAGVHDAVSGNMGSGSPVAVVSDDEVWFANASGFPCVIPAGGRPLALPGLYVSGGSSSVQDPFGFSLAPTFSSPQILAVNPTDSFNYKTVWFSYASSGFTAGRVILVCDAERRRLLSWFVPYTGAAIKALLVSYTFATGGGPQPAVIDGTAGRFLVLSGSGADTNAAGTRQTTTYRLIGGPLGGDTDLEQVYDRLSVVCGSGITSGTMDVQLLTSRRNDNADISTAQTVSIDSANGVFVELVHRSVGLDQRGRWCRPVFTLATASTSHGFRLASWTVWAAAASLTPELV